MYIHTLYMITIITFIDYIGYYGPVILFALTFYCLLNRTPYLIAFTFGSILNTYANEVLKQIFREPRPPNQLVFIDSNHLTGAHHYGLPSGHAQTTAFSLAFLALSQGPPAFLYFMTGIFAITLYQRWKYNRHNIKQLAFGVMVGAFMAWLIHFMTQYVLHGYKYRVSFL